MRASLLLEGLLKAAMAWRYQETLPGSYSAPSRLTEVTISLSFDTN